MVCAKCGTLLHPQALSCWKCGLETSNYTDDMKALFAKADKENRLLEQAWENPDGIPVGKQKLMRVYRRTCFGKILIGWVDENGSTFSRKWPFGQEWKPHWSVDEQGRIYLESGEIRAFVGWIGDNGAVYAQYGRALSGFFAYPEKLRMIRPQKSLCLILLFRWAPMVRFTA